jgi:hypothetical protein
MSPLRVNRNQVEPAASRATSVIAPKAEVIASAADHYELMALPEP